MYVSGYALFMIDSHCHLADKQFQKDLNEVIERAKESGVDRCIAIADSLPEGIRCLEIAEKYEGVYCTIGVHPHISAHWKSGNRQQLRTMIQSSEKVVAVGEIGLDYHYNNSPQDVQREVFEIQLQLAKELNIPAVLHCREAIEDLKSIITKVDPASFVLHCCTEKWEDVSSLVENRFFLSFTGIATYPKSEDIREVIKQCPLEQMMIETDSPYLAPEPYRGKRNEPAYVVEVAKLIAELKGKSFEEIDSITTANTVEFFGLPVGS